MDYVEVLYGYEKRLSLSDCTRDQAKQVIEVILDWMFHNNIPLNYKTSDLLKNDKAGNGQSKLCTMWEIKC